MVYVFLYGLSPYMAIRCCDTDIHDTVYSMCIFVFRYGLVYVCAYMAIDFMQMLTPPS